MQGNIDTEKLLETLFSKSALSVQCKNYPRLLLGFLIAQDGGFLTVCYLDNGYHVYLKKAYLAAPKEEAKEKLIAWLQEHAISLISPRYLIK